MKKTSLYLLLATCYLLLAAKAAHAQEIVNEAIRNIITEQGTAGGGLAFYIAQLWKTVVVVSGLAFLLYTVWGGIEWMMSKGDKASVEEARHKITNSLIGMTIVVAAYAFVSFIGAALKIDLLRPVFPVNF